MKVLSIFGFAKEYGVRKMTENEFKRNVELNSKRVFLVALSYTKNKDDAEDIMQNAFLKLWKSKESFESDEHIGKWLTVVTSNECKNLLKFYKKRADEPSFDLSESFPFKTVEDKEIFNAVMKLPPKNALVIHLFYYEDMTVKEIAKTLNVSENAVKTRLCRGREKLKELLGGTWKDE